MKKFTPKTFLKAINKETFILTYRSIRLQIFQIMRWKNICFDFWQIFLYSWLTKNNQLSHSETRHNKTILFMLHFIDTISRVNYWAHNIFILEYLMNCQVNNSLLLLRGRDDFKRKCVLNICCYFHQLVTKTLWRRLFSSNCLN